MRDDPTERLKKFILDQDASGFFAQIGPLRLICGYPVPELGNWEHVSVSRQDRTPTWAEMVAARQWIWKPTETVVQFHVPASDHVNCHPYCLHLWRQVGVEFPRPPAELVG